MHPHVIEMCRIIDLNSVERDFPSIAIPCKKFPVFQFPVITSSDRLCLITRIFFILTHSYPSSNFCLLVLILLFKGTQNKSDFCYDVSSFTLGHIVSVCL